MTKPVTGLTVFGSNTSGTTTQLDNNFGALRDALNDFGTYSNYLSDTGAANAYSVSLPASITGTLADGLLLQMKVSATNSGASVLNYDGGGNKPVVNLDGSALSAGQMPANGVVQLQYSSALTSWMLQTVTANASSGAMVLLSSKSANANATIDFNNALSSQYDTYQVVITGMIPQTDLTSLIMRVGTGNTPTFQTANYRTNIFGVSSNVSGVSSASTSADTGIPIAFTAGTTRAVGNANGDNLSAVITIAGPALGVITQVTGRSGYSGGGNTTQMSTVGDWVNNTVVTSLRFFTSNGNIANGNFALYGLVKS